MSKRNISTKLISHHVQIKPFVRQLVSLELNSRANPIDPVDVSNLDHLSGQEMLSKVRSNNQNRDTIY